jgi:hypothetical protein
MPKLELPFSHVAIRSIQEDMGVNRYKAIRAMNLTSGNVDSARDLLRLK